MTEKKYKSIAELLENEVEIHFSDPAVPLITQLHHVRNTGYLVKPELLRICKWKDPRELRRRDWNANTEESVKILTGQALSETDEAKRIQHLINIKGVGTAIGSALLTLVYPEKYGVIDTRVWRLLYLYDEVGHNPYGKNLSISDWLLYLPKLRDWSDEFGVEARQIELTLFEHHKATFTGKL